MDVSENSGTPKSSNLIGFSIVNHPFWGTPIFGNTHIRHFKLSCNTPPVDDKGGQDCQRYLRSQVICIGDLTIHLGKKIQGWLAAGSVKCRDLKAMKLNLSMSDQIKQRWPAPKSSVERIAIMPESLQFVWLRTFTFTIGDIFAIGNPAGDFKPSECSSNWTSTQRAVNEKGHWNHLHCKSGNNNPQILEEYLHNIYIYNIDIDTYV